MKSYMTVDGIKFPELIEAEGGGQKVTIKTNKITLNSGVSEADLSRKMDIMLRRPDFVPVFYFIGILLKSLTHF